MGSVFNDCTCLSFFIFYLHFLVHFCVFLIFEESLHIILTLFLNYFK